MDIKNWPKRDYYDEKCKLMKEYISEKLQLSSEEMDTIKSIVLNGYYGRKFSAEHNGLGWHEICGKILMYGPDESSFAEKLLSRNFEIENMRNGIDDERLYEEFSKAEVMFWVLSKYGLLSPQIFYFLEKAKELNEKETKLYDCMKHTAKFYLKETEHLNKYLRQKINNKSANTTY